MKATYRFSAILTLSYLGACVSAPFEDFTCPAGQVSNGDDTCSPAGASGSGGGGSSAGGGMGGAPPSSTLTLQVPPELVGLRRARRKDVPVKLSATAPANLSVAIDGLPPYMTAEALTLPAGSTEGVLVVQATNEAPLGVPLALRVEAKGAPEGAIEATINLWVMGEPGTLDESYGTGGVVTTELVKSEEGNFELITASSIDDEDRVVVLTVNQDKTVLTGGGVAVVTNVYRYLANGQLDPSYGKAGKASYDFGGPDEQDFGFDARAMRDGRVVFAAERRRSAFKAGTTDTITFSNPRLIVARLHESGLRDDFFGPDLASKGYSDYVDGYVDYAQDDDFIALGSLAVNDDEKSFFVAKSYLEPGSNFLVAKITADGAIDSTFSVRQPTPAATYDELLPADEFYCVPVHIAPRNGGAIVIGTKNVKESGGTGKNSRVCLESYLPNGQLDPSFGEGGKVLLTPPEASDDCRLAFASSVAVGSDGNVYASGGFESCGTTTSAPPFVTRLTAAGALDPTYGQGSTWSRPELRDYYIPRDNLVLSPDGSIAALVVRDDGRLPHLVFISPNGQPVEGDAVAHALPLPHTEDGVYTRPLMRQKDGRLIVVGGQFGGGLAKQWLVRVWPQ